MLSIPPVELEGLEKAMNQSLDAVFKVGMNQIRSLPSDSRESQSEGAQSMERDNTYALVESTIEQVEAGVNKALSHYAAFKGIDSFEGTFELCDEISEASFQRLIEIIGAARDYIRGVPTVDKSIRKKLAKMLELDEEELAEAIKEIDSGAGEEEQQLAAASERQNLLSALNGGQEAKPAERPNE